MGFLAALAPLVAVLAPTTLAATATPSRHAAQPAVLTLRATFELQCGRTAAATVGLPAAMGMRTIASKAITVNGAHPASVRASGHVVQVTMPPPQGVLCNSIGPGRVTVRFTRAAGLANPIRPGSYALWLRVRGQTATGRLHIS